MKRLSVFFAVTLIAGMVLFFSNARAEFTFTSLDYPSADRTHAYGINELGHIAGYCKDGSGAHGFFYNGTNFFSIDYPGASYTRAYGINDFVHIVGYYYDGSNMHGFLSGGGSFTAIDFPGASHTYAYDINNSGHIVGRFIESGNEHGFLYDGATFTRLDYPDSISTIAYGINDSGEIVGTYDDASGAHGFYYDGAGFTTIDFPGLTPPNTILFGINEAGVIAGGALTPEDSQGFLYDGTDFTPVEYPGAPFTEAWDLNDRNQVVGWYRDTDENAYGFLAETRVEPWRKAYNGLFDSSSNLTLLRKYRDAFLSKTFEGRFYTFLLYKNSKEALEVLLDNPDLMEEAGCLIERNKGAVLAVQNGKRGVISNTAGIASFLTRFAKKSPPALKWLVTAVKKDMLRKKWQGREFLGFSLE